MIAGSLGRRYARALMSIGVEQKNYEKLGRELGGLAAAMKVSPELNETLSNPAFPRDDRRKVLEVLLRRVVASPVTRNFTLLLLDRDRLKIVPDVSRELDRLIDERAGRTTATVTSATKLTKAQLAKLKAALEKLSGKTVTLDNKEDPELLGGVVAKVGDTVYDGSLRTQLERMRQNLPRG